MKFILLSLIPGSVAILTAQEPLRQASEARLWLEVPTTQPPLRDVRISEGDATVSISEINTANKHRLTDISFPIRWRGWTELAVTFTSPEDGVMNLVLSGPWAEAPAGSALRMEVLWDDLSAEGLQLANGGFESQTKGVPNQWEAIYRPYLAADSWPLKGAEPLNGKALATTWHGRPLSQKLILKAGQEITLRFHAKAATLPDFSPPRLLEKDTPAHKAIAGIKRGVNLGNYWDCHPLGSEGIRYRPEDIDRIAAEGFDHIRFGVAWQHYLKPVAGGYEIDPILLNDLEPMMRRALDQGLHALVDWHNFKELTEDANAHRTRFTAGWATISNHFKSWPPELFFEILNEPHGELTTEVMNSIYADTIAGIRKHDPKRILFVTTGNWSDPRELDNLRLPDGDDRLVATIHCYEPFPFSHQGAAWVGLGALRGIRYPGPPSVPMALPESLNGNNSVREFITGYNSLPAAQNPSSANRARELLDQAREWSDHFGRPVHLGEFGSTRIADPRSRSRHATDVRKIAEERMIPWTWWDWKAGFGYWDDERNEPLLRNALFD